MTVLACPLDRPRPAPARHGAWRILADLVRAWRARRRDERQLRGLDERLLRDVGLVRLRDHAGRETFARCDESGQPG